MNDDLDEDDRLWAIEQAVNTMATLLSIHPDMSRALTALRCAIDETIAAATAGKRNGADDQAEKRRWEAVRDLLRPRPYRASPLRM